MRHHRRQRGFALLMTLLLVLMAGTVMAAVAWRSVAGAMEARGATEELQRRWAVVSCRHTLLGRVEELLDEAERGRDPRDQGKGIPQGRYRNKPVPELRVRCRLGDVDYELVLTDEQAKLNVDRLVGRVGRASAQVVAHRVVRGSSSDLPVVVKLQTVALGRTSAGERMATLGGYGQVFEGLTPEQLIGSPTPGGPASFITLWGDGAVNIRRAPAAVIEQACEGVLGPSGLRALLAARERDPYRALPEMFAQIDGIDAKQQAKLASRLTDRSSCHGLWVIERGPQRSWYTLAVGTGGSDPNNGAAPVSGRGGGVTPCYEFAW